MQIRYISLTIFIIIILIAQLIINNANVLYLDCLTLILVALLLEGFFSIRILLALCLLADLFGHWYLGTHLLAIILVSFPIKAIVNFYRVSNLLQKVVLNGIFALIAYSIIGLIEVLIHKTNINWINLLIELVFINPIILLVLNKFIIKVAPDIIRTE